MAVYRVKSTIFKDLTANYFQFEEWDFGSDRHKVVFRLDGIKDTKAKWYFKNRLGHIPQFYVLVDFYYFDGCHLPCIQEIMTDFCEKFKFIPSCGGA